MDKSLFAGPRGVAVDKKAIYVADTGNDVIRMIDISSLRTSTLAGTGEEGDKDGSAAQAQFNNPGALKSKEMSAFDAFNSVQDHVLHAASAHIDRVVLEAFVAGIDSCEDDEAREILGLVRDLYALTVIEDDKAWFVEHRLLVHRRAKAVTRGINDRCRLLRPHAETLVDGFGIPEPLRYAEMLHPEKRSRAAATSY